MLFWSETDRPLPEMVQLASELSRLLELEDDVRLQSVHVSRYDDDEEDDSEEEVVLDGMGRRLDL